MTHMVSSTASACHRSQKVEGPSTTSSQTNARQWADRQWGTGELGDGRSRADGGDRHGLGAPAGRRLANTAGVLGRCQSRLSPAGSSASHARSDHHAVPRNGAPGDGHRRRSGTLFVQDDSGIEECHKAPKTGCRVEGRQVRTADRFLPLIGFLSMVVVRLLQLRQRARRRPKAAGRRWSAGGSAGGSGSECAPPRDAGDEPWCPSRHHPSRRNPRPPRRGRARVAKPLAWRRALQRKEDVRRRMGSVSDGCAKAAPLRAFLVRAFPLSLSQQS